MEPRQAGLGCAVLLSYSSQSRPLMPGLIVACQRPSSKLGHEDLIGRDPPDSPEIMPFVNRR